MTRDNMKDLFQGDKNVLYNMAWDGDYPFQNCTIRIYMFSISKLQQNY